METQHMIHASLFSPTYLYVIWRGLVTGSLEGLGHIAKDLHRGQQVTSIKVPPLGEVEQVFCHLGHPIPRQHPLALCKVPLNLQKQEKTELGASMCLRCVHTKVKWSAKNQEERLKLCEVIYVTLIRKSGWNVFCLMFWDQAMWIKELTGAEDTHLGINCTAMWHFTSLHRLGH